MTGTDVFKLKHLTFAGGQEFDVPAVGVVVLVGPNNVGKSTALGEIATFVASGALAHNNRLNVAFAGAVGEIAAPDGVEAWLQQFVSEFIPDVSNPSRKTYRNWGSSKQLGVGEIEAAATQAEHRSWLREFLICAGPMAQFDGQAPDLFSDGGMGTQNKQFEDLYYDRKIEARISELSQRIFGTPVSLSRFGRTSVLFFGLLPEVENPPTDEQRRLIRSVPRVSEQGEGVRGFLNLALTLELGIEPIVLLDEPDAHLHPPQAYAAGKFVAERGRRSQVFVVTHSLEFLHGIVDSDSDVAVVRMDRASADSVTSVSVLSAVDLKRTWRDTAVRYSGALSGLMHKGVVLCEGDGDCRYYEVALDHFHAGATPHDLRFIHAGGKAGLKKLARALSAIAVPVSCVVDFDFIREWRDISDLLDALRASPVDIEPDWKLLDQQLRQQTDTRSISAIRASIDEVLRRAEESGERRHGRSLQRSIAEVLKLQDGWSSAKRVGLVSARGEPYEAGKRVLNALSKVGVHVLPFGELESLHPGISAHGPSFVDEVIAGEMYKDLGHDQVTFIRQIGFTHRPFD